jgi:allantoinase
MAIDLIIKDAILVSSDGTTRGSVAINEGCIVAIGAADYLPVADEVIDAGGKYLIPGVIDIHVHFRDPGLTYKEDFATGTMAAAAGGVTTIFDMPNVKPVVVNVETFETKRQAIQNKAFVNFGLYVFLLGGNQDQVDTLIDAGVAGFKWYMSIEDTGIPAGYHLPNNGEAWESFRRIAAHGYNVGVHAEDRALIEWLAQSLRAAEYEGARFHLDSRPDWVEVAALQRAMMLADLTGCHLHVHHLSSQRGLELIKQRRRDGLSVTCEVCPQYMLFSAERYAEMGPLIKVLPPIKYHHDAEALWQGLLDGAIDCLATDHAPHTKEEKLERLWDMVPPGVNGVQTSVPLMLDQVNQGILQIEHLVKVACERPAQIYGLFPRKGVIRVGADADLVLLDMEQSWMITNTAMLSKNQLTPYHGRTVQGCPVLTIVNGHVVMRDGQIVGSPVGKMVNPRRNW